ncbi:CBO0543 family protein [Anaerobacillus sp. MEB173]|uniref:CBO0543 family protein n=1 Tax=Anaerobacillus sp. MEB173 TaxID=3383345 RepID=UPI003F9329D8
MSKEKGLLVFSWVLVGSLLVLLVPKNKIRQAHIAFLFQQVITWSFGLIVAENKLIQYPRRFFKKSNKASFTFEYFVFPAVSVFFNLYYPEKHKAIIKTLYYSFYLSVLSGLELFALKFTKLIRYIHWKWYWSTITMGITLFISRRYYRWFFAKEFNE